MVLSTPATRSFGYRLTYNRCSEQDPKSLPDQVPDRTLANTIWRSVLECPFVLAERGGGGGACSTGPELLDKLRVNILREREKSACACA